MKLGLTLNVGAAVIIIPLLGFICPTLSLLLKEATIERAMEARARVLIMKDGFMASFVESKAAFAVDLMAVYSPCVVFCDHS
jgi:hypothetical protein